METEPNVSESILVLERALESERNRADVALARASAVEQRADHLQRIVLRLQREVDDLQSNIDFTNAGLQTIRAHDPENLDPPLPAQFVGGYHLSEEDAVLLRDGYARRDRRIAMLMTLCKSSDEKFAHVWREYEYYLNEWRKVSGVDPASDSDAS
jgi:hypothetical protein